MQNTLDRIVAYLNAHNVAGGKPTVIGASAGRIRVQSLLSGPDGAVELVAEDIEPKMLAARIWLGY